MSVHDVTAVLTAKLEKILLDWPTNGMGGKIHVNLIYGDTLRGRQAMGFLNSLHKSGLIEFKSYELGKLPPDLVTADGCLKLENADRAFACPVAFVEAPDLSTRSQAMEGLSDIVSIAKMLTEAANIVAHPDGVSH